MHCVITENIIRVVKMSGKSVEVWWQCCIQKRRSYDNFMRAL